MAYKRVRLEAQDGGGDNVVVFVPLRDDGTYDPDAPKPHLARVVWAGEDWYATFRVDPDEPTNVFQDWCSASGVEDACYTDLLTAPLREGGIVDVAGYWFVVRSIVALDGSAEPPPKKLRLAITMAESLARIEQNAHLYPPDDTDENAFGD